MINIKNLIFVGIFFSFQSCVNLSLESNIPKKTYHSIDNEPTLPNCTNVSNGAVVMVNVLSPYDTKDILFTDGYNEINFFSNMKWIDLPKNMIRNAFIKIGLNNCIQINSNIRSGQKLNILRINVNDMYINNDIEKIAKVYMSYEITSYSGNHIDNGIVITTAKNINPIKSIQEAVSSALKKIIIHLPVGKDEDS